MNTMRGIAVNVMFVCNYGEGEALGEMLEDMLGEAEGEDEGLSLGEALGLVEGLAPTPILGATFHLGLNSKRLGII